MARIPDLRGKCKKINLAVHSPAMQNIKKIQESLGCASYEETVRRSLELAAILVEARQRKNLILIQDTMTGNVEKIIF